MEAVHKVAIAGVRAVGVLERHADVVELPGLLFLLADAARAKVYFVRSEVVKPAWCARLAQHALRVASRLASTACEPTLLVLDFLPLALALLNLLGALGVALLVHARFRSREAEQRHDQQDQSSAPHRGAVDFQKELGKLLLEPYKA